MSTIGEGIPEGPTLSFEASVRLMPIIASERQRMLAQNRRSFCRGRFHASLLPRSRTACASTRMNFVAFSRREVAATPDAVLQDGHGVVWSDLEDLILNSIKYINEFKCASRRMAEKQMSRPTTLASGVQT
jgi:hypothetical protein